MKKNTMKRWLGILLAVVMIFTGSAYGLPNMANVVEAASAGTNEYGLCDNIQDGVILHCFDWKYTDIKAELPSIAAAGFTSIQTSPAQKGDGSVWYWLYQPQTFSIQQNALGNKAELKALCDEAEKYGIKIVVDVVANHTRAIGDDGLGSDCYHNDGDAWYTDRYGITHGKIGMPDLNSESTTVQNKVKGYIEELKSVGVDGIRWDAAKHISLPSEQCQFWPVVTGVGLWNYGEILVGPTEGGTDDPAGKGLMKEYTNYMSVTDSKYGAQVREAFVEGRVPSTIGIWSENGVSKDKLVYWSESHDTYSNNGEYGEATQFHDQNKIDRAYAIVAGQSKASALYFSRPFETDKERIMAGAKGSTHFASAEVAAINHLHNACVGEPDYYVGDTQNNVAAVCRTSGAVVALGSGSNRDVTVANGGGTVTPGTYVDEVSGGTWTVTSTTMSGHVGNTGIAVFYKAEPVVRKPKPTISKEGGNFSDTLTLTIGLSNATSGTYKIGNGAAETYTSSKQITIGSDMAFGDSVTITLTATDGSQTETKTYTFTKVEQTGNVVYLSLPSGWNTPVYCYAYVSGVEEGPNNAKWPGVEMTLDTVSGYYKYEIPDNITTPEVILHDGSDDNRTSPDMQPGKVIDGSWLYKDGAWSEYSSPVTRGKVIVQYVDDNGNSVAAEKTLTGTVGSSYTTTAATVPGYRLKQTPDNANGTYTAADITVKYVYERTSDDSINITSSQPDGYVFSTETATITIKAENATSATYRVDGGPVKPFNGSANVVIGQGKIADRDVTVEVTATNGTDTVNKTFTYRKEFNGNVINETANVRSSAGVARASGTLASQYSTNAAGVGTEKTISVDGDISDWDASMKIAQGAANDDPRVYRPNSMYENPVDLYALYGAYDDNNVYLMWEMTNVQDVVAPSDNYPLSQGTLWQTQEFPFFIAVDTGKSDVIGNKGTCITGGTIWNSGMTIENSFNRLISINTKGGNGPFVYCGDSSGLNPVEQLDATTSGIKMNYGKGILTATVNGINGAYGESNGRVVGDIYDNSADWVDFNTKGHDSASMDFFYELSIPYTELGITKDDVKQNGIGVLLVGTMGKSPMDCLPYDGSMNDNAALDDSAGSQENNSFEKSDDDYITCSFARIGKSGGSGPTPPIPPTPTDPIVNFGADRSSPQLNTTQLLLEAIASSGTAPYQYEFFVDGASVQSKSSTATYTWNPTVGNHTIKVTVTDSNGKTVSSQKAYVIEESGNIDPTDIKVSFKNEAAKYVYNGQEQRPEIVVKDGTKTLAEGTDYSLTYANNVNAGDKDSANAPKVTIVGKGNYATKIESKTLTFTIEKAEIPVGAPAGTMTAAAGSITALALSAGWEWSDSSKNIVVQEGVTILAEAVYNGTDKENYKTTTVSVSLTGISCNHVGTGRETIITLKATCTQAGRQNVICTTCHVTISEGEVIPALGHTGGTANCISQAICIRCGEKYGTFNSNNHVHTVVENEIKANCQQAGYTGDTRCKDCNTEISKGKPVSKTDHVWDAGTVTKAATATTDGVKTYTCKVCGGKKTETIPKTGGSTTEQKDPIVPVENPKVGDPVEDAASKGIYKVTQATAAVKTVEFTLPSSSVKDVTIPDKIVINGTAYQVTSIASNAFKNNKTVQTVKMGSNIKTIGENAFYGCSNLKKVTLSKNLTTIGNMAFYKCTKLTSVTIPSKVSKIGSKAFYGCSSLKKVTLSSSLTTIGSQAFYKCTKLTSITIPAKVSKIGSKAFYGCKKLKKITIKTKKLTSKKVGSQAFKGIAAKATIKVPKSKLTSYKKILKAKGVGSKAKITK